MSQSEARPNRSERKKAPPAVRSKPQQQFKRILLVDDHPLMRRGQADLLSREKDFMVCGEAGTAREAMEAIAKLKPDLVVDRKSVV